jgi:plasmid maintenance system antidote protein VapI
MAPTGKIVARSLSLTPTLNLWKFKLHHYYPKINIDGKSNSGDKMMLMWGQPPSAVRRAKLDRFSRRLPLSEEQNIMPMKNPPHLGRSIRPACLEPLGLSITEGGDQPQMAIRLSKAFGSTPETWLRMQLTTISHRREKTRAKSKSAVSMCPKNYTRSEVF